MANNVEERLRVCFRTVFPDLPEKDISSASQTHVAAWDSEATVPLVSVIDDEFGVELGLDKAEVAFLPGLLVRIRGQVEVF